MDNLHIIAEAGTNHNASLQTARELVDVAAGAGADSVKFQLIYPEGLYLPRFFSNGEYTENEVFQKRLAGMLKDDDYVILSEYCREKGIPFTATAFDSRGIDFLDKLEVPYFKIASCDLNNSPLLTEAAERGRKMIISTGMASLGEIERAVTDVTAKGNNDIVLMHCVSVYPCTTEGMNLNFIRILKETFGFPVGLSDHTEKSLAVAVAVSMGAEWFEKHFTLDRSSEGFDHAYAMEPGPLAEYIKDIHSVNEACCRQNVKVQSTEATVKSRARRALYAARDIAAGEVINEKDILIVRPEGPLVPNDISLVLGKRADRDIKKLEAYSLDLVR